MTDRTGGEHVAVFYQSEIPGIHKKRVSGGFVCCQGIFQLLHGGFQLKNVESTSQNKETDWLG